MHINDLDMNLLRVFDAVYRTRNVSRAAEVLALSQPATSQALTRLRLLLKDALFVRGAGGVSPTPKADRLAQAVRTAISTVEAALSEAEQFDPASSQKIFRFHLSDIGEARFLPALMAALHRNAPGVRVQSSPLPHGDISAALDSGRLDFAIGFLPSVHDTQHVELLHDCYVVLLRSGHPVFDKKPTRAIGLKQLAKLEYVAVRSHAETLRILQLLRLEDRLRLTASHFLALPAIVRSTELGAVMPKEIAAGFAAGGGYTLVEPRLPLRNFTVSLHWSRRFDADPALVWLRELLVSLFKGSRPGA
jgi:DNA-binding transcriptional LysR family regulator